MRNAYSLINEDDWEFGIQFHPTKRTNMVYSCGEVDDMRHLVRQINKQYSQMKEYRRDNINLKKKFEANEKIVVEPKSKLPIIRSKSKLNNYRKRIRKRDKGACKCCGNTEDLQVHHIFPLSKYEDIIYDDGNGITLCKDCHDEYHRRYDEPNPINLMEFLKEVKE